MSELISQVWIFYHNINNFRYVKKEHHKEIQTAVHDEYKKLGFKSRSIGSNNLSSKTDSELKKELSKGLNEALEQIKKKLKG